MYFRKALLAGPGCTRIKNDIPGHNYGCQPSKIRHDGIMVFNTCPRPALPTGLLSDFRAAWYVCKKEKSMVAENDIGILLKYFPNLREDQKNKFEALGKLFSEWNEKINLVSRKDIEFLYEKHILHSLAIARIIHFSEGTSVLDVGTGGGFPGIPLAIYFPDVQFTLVDSIGKKIKVVKDIEKALNLK